MLIPAIPTTTRAVPREDLLAAYSQFDASSQEFQAEKLLPPMPVGKEIGEYSTLNRAQFMRHYNTKRAPRAKTSESAQASGSRGWSLAEYAHQEMLTQRDVDLYGDRFSAEEVAIQRVGRVVGMDYEFDVSSLLFNTTTYPNDGVNGLDPSVPWSTFATAKPIDDVTAGKLAFRAKYGSFVNAMALTWELYTKLPLISQLRGMLTQNFGQVLPSEIPVAALQAIFGIEEIIVLKPQVCTSNEGADTQSLSTIYPTDQCLLFRKPKGNDIKEFCTGRTLKLRNFDGVKLDSYEINDPPDTWYVRAREIKTPHLTDEAPAFLLQGLLS